MNPLAKPFVPGAKRGPEIVKSVRYFGKPQDFDNIKALFQTYNWPPNVQTIYVTNGWHQGFEGRNGVLQQVEYCGFSVNIDSDTHKQHFYKG
jgi:hypothetical protein